MKTIGFANKFYTLWNVETTNMPVVHNAIQVGSFDRVNCYYIQNLSFDYDKAVERLKELYGDVDFVFDDSLKGSSDFEYETNYVVKDGKGFDRFPGGISSYQDGMLISEMGSNIIDENGKYSRSAYFENKALIALFTYFRDKKYSQCDEAYTQNVFNLPGTFLYRVKQTGSGNIFKDLNPRQAVYAKNRLIELGLIEGFEGSWFTKTEIQDILEKRRKESATFYFNEGDKVELEIIQTNSTGYATNYGTVFIITYNDKAGNKFFYKGSNPPESNYDEFKKVKATVKHNEYNGEKQTLLQRIKFL